MYSPVPEHRGLSKTGRQIFAAGLIGALLIGAFAIYRAAQPAQWDPALEPYVAFIEAERGLTFDHPVNVRWTNIAEEIANEQAAARDTSIFSIGDDDDAEASTDIPLDPWLEAYRVLGLVDPNPDRALDEAVTETLAENAGAFYTPWDETIVLPEGQPAEALSVTIVHELTHALQHQNGLLGFFPDSADGATARTAIAEGDAERIAMAWYWSRTDAERQEYLDAIGYDPTVTPPDPGDNYFAASFYASYGIGLPMVEAIVASEGQGAVDELLRAKDAGTTERLIDVYATSDRSAVDAMDVMGLPPGAVGADGDMGALTWFQALAPIVGTERAFDALIGYDDDAFAMYLNDDEMACVRFEMYFDADGETVEFVEVLNEAGIPVEQRETPSGQAARMDLCDAIGDSADQRFGTIMPLVVVNELTWMHTENGEPQDVARCAAISQASTIPIRSTEAFIGWEQLTANTSQYVESCR